MRKALWLPDVSRGTLAALLLAAPVAAQASGFAGAPVVVHGTATITASGNVQTVTIPTSSAVTTINWTPTDIAVGGGAINFLPTGQTVSYVGTTGNSVPYNILNRIIPTDQTRTVAFNGTVTSTANTHVWFYSPGGLLIGGTAVFNVGGLVLTTADPVLDSDNNFITTSSGSDVFSFAGVAGSTSAITIQPGASISALNSGQSNYIVAFAPKIAQGGTIAVAGSVALVAAESASFAVDSQGLFNITVSAGTTVANDTFVHTGSTGGPNAAATGSDQRVYMVAVPKNNAISMAIASSGSIGFAVADAANVDGNTIVLSAGGNIADTGSGNPVVAGRAGTGTASLTVGGGNYTSNAYAVSTDLATVTDSALSISFASDLSVIAPQAKVNAQIGTIAVTGDLTVNADDTLTGTGGTASLLAGPGSVTVGGNALVSANASWQGGTQNPGIDFDQAGTATVAVSGGQLSVGGTLTASAIADATGANAALAANANPEFDTGANANGGAAAITVGGAGATLTATAGIAAHADAIGSYDQFGGGGNAVAGTALIKAQSGGAISVGNNGAIAATANASAATGQAQTQSSDYFGGGSAGGTAQVIANAGSITVAGVQGITALANAHGGDSIGEQGSGGYGNGGTALIATQGASGSITTNTSGFAVQSDFASAVEANANGGNAAGFGFTGGQATGGTATLQVTGSGQSIAFDHGNSLLIEAGATGGTGIGNSGGRATGGTAQLLASGGSIAITNAGLAIDASGTAGQDNDGNGGAATGGSVQLAASNGGTVNAQQSITLTASATGGNSEASAGGAATGGTVKLTADSGGSVTIATSPFISVSATGGSGSGTGGSALGGNIFIAMGNNAINFDPVDGTPELDASYTPGDSEGGPLAASSSAGGVLLTDLGTLNLAGGLSIDGNTALYAQAGGSINVSGSISGTDAGAYLHLWADDLGTGTGTVTLASGALNLPGNLIDIYYDPTSLGTPTDFSGGVQAGTATAYQLVDNVDQLQLVGSYLSQNFALGKNIDASATAGWNGGAGFVPVGNADTPFSGNFDGLGHSVTNLFINDATTNDVGLFGAVHATTNAISIRNTGLVNSTVQASGNGGLLIGYIAQASCACSVSLSNDYSGGSIQGSFDVGGLVGLIANTSGAGSTVTIVNSHSDSVVSGSDQVGGLVGDGESATLQNVFATGSVNGTDEGGSAIGGLAGFFRNGQISNSYATGAVSTAGGAHNIGGLVGDLADSTLTTSYAVGSVEAGTGSFNIGGLIGLNYSSITESWASGAVSAPTSTDVGGFVGYNRAASVSNGTGAGTITNSYWDTYSTGQAAGAGRNTSTITNLNSVTSDPAQSSADNYAFKTNAYTNLPGSDWTYDNNMTRPIGAWETPVAQFGVATISSAHQVQLIDYDMTGHYTVTQNIDMIGTTGTTDIWAPGGFMPLGGEFDDPPFTGVLAGGGHVLSNLSMTPSGLVTNAGFIQENYGTIQDLGLSNISIVSTYANNTGAIAGINAGQIIDSFAIGTITLSHQGVAGGLVGTNADAATTGTAGSITQSYASVAVTNGDTAGGLVGDNEGAIAGSYANGAVGGALTGGLVGVSADTSGPTVTNSYWDSQLSGQSAGCGAIGYSGACSGVTGLTTAQTLQAASFVGFAIDTQGGQGLPWRQYAGDTTPLLAAFLTPITVQPNSLTMQYDAQVPDVGVTMYGAQPALTFGTAVVNGLTRNAGVANATYGGGLYSNQLGYDFVPSTTPGTVTITPAPLTLGASGDSRVYDGTTVSNTGDGVYVLGILGNDSVGNRSQSFVSPNVMGANGSTIVVDPGYVINDGNGGNNYTVTLLTATGTISPAPLTLAAASQTRVYDATTGSARAVQVSGLFGQDNVTSLTQSFASPNVLGPDGSTLAVNPGYVVNDGNGGNNYTVTLQTAPGTITPAALTLAAVSDSRSYNATTASTGVVQVSGLFGQDNVTSLTQSFASPNATGLNGATLVVNPGYVVNDGNGGNNYTVTLQSSLGNMTPAALTLTAVTQTRGYNATTGSTGVVQVSGLFGQDNVTGTSQSYASPNAMGTNGSTLVVNPGYAINDGNGGFNYTVTLNSAPGTITPAALAITYTANPATSTYGFTPSGLSGTVSVQGLQGNDTLAAVTAGAPVFTTAATAQSNVGHYAITGSGLVSESGNYSFSFVQAAGNAAALTIVPADLTVNVLANAQSRSYGAANPALTYSETGLVNGDTLTGSLATAATITSNVGTYAITQGTLSASPNYVLNYTGANLTVTPTNLTITYIASPITNIYGTVPGGLGGNVGTAGLVLGQTLASVTSGTALFTTAASATSNVGTYAITGSGLTANSVNYSFNFVQAAANATAQTIAQRALTLTANPLSRTYGSAEPITDAATAAPATATTGLVNGNSVSSEAISSPATSGSGVGSYALNGSGAQFTSGQASNYAITYASNPTGLTITPAAATITYVANPISSIYGNVPSGLAGTESATGLVNGDTLDSVTSGTAGFATTATGLSNVGSYAITGSGLSGSTSNYTFSFAQAAGNATALTIVQRALTLTADPISRVYGSAEPITDNATADPATATTGLVNDNSVSGETVSSPATAGSGVGTYALNGSAAQFGSGLASNYAITYASNPTGLTITPVAATITYVANPLSSIYGTTPSGLSGTENASGLVNGDTLGGVTSGTASFATTATGLSNVGAYAIIGSGLTAGTSNYTFNFVQAAGNASALNIVQRALTLTADPVSRVYGSAEPITDTVTAGPATATTGLVNGNSVSSEAVISQANAVLGVGTYALGGSAAQFGSGLASNYAITYVSNPTGLTITPAAATITYVANPLSSIYGNVPSLLSGSESASGLVNGDTLGSVTSGTASFASTATGLANVGSYAITGSGLASSTSNYTLNFVQAAGNATALTIVQRALTLTADPISRVYGSANPNSDTATAALATTTTGLVNGDSIGTETITSPATPSSGVGSYALGGAAAQFTSGAASNYAITYAANPTGLTITPAAATITYVANPLSSIYGNTPTGLSGTEIASGLVNGDTLSSVTSGTAGFATTATGLANVGTYAIVGSGLAGNTGNYTFSFVQAAGNAAALTIVQRALTLTADPVTRVYGSANPISDTATAALATATTGLVNGDSVGSETVTSPAMSASGVGAYALDGSAAQFGAGLPGNYAITYATNAGGLAITPAPLTLTYTANPGSSIYGQAPARLSGGTALIGLVNGDTAAGVTSGTALWTTPAGATSNVGSYAINGAGIGLASANYALTSVQAPGNATALTVNPAALSIIYTAGSASRTYGAENPALTGTETAAGLVGGDTLSSVTSGTAAFATTAAATANVGSYAITGSGLAGSSLNYTYSFTQAAGNATALAVAPAAATITYIANPLSSIYGNVPGGLSGTESASGLVNGDTLGSITTGVASFATTASSASNVGTYAVTGSGLAASNGNYSFSFAQAPGNATALTITPRPITVTADPQQRPVGGTDPVFTYVVTPSTDAITTGLVNGDVLAGQLTSTATIASPAGQYDILQGSLAASANYQLSYVGNILTLVGATIPIADVTAAIEANLPDQPGIGTPDQRKKQAAADLAALYSSLALHPAQISQSMINDHLVTTPAPVNEPVTSNGNSSLWSPKAP